MATTITDARAFLVDVAVETERTDAVQSFVKQETIFVELTTSDGLHGRGYSYTIGTGGRAVLSMLRDHLLDLLIGQEADRIEAIWHRLFASTRATTTGAITSLALAAVDTALWDVAAQRAGLPLWRLAGGFRRDVPLYDTEGGWLHLSVDDLVDGRPRLAAQGPERRQGQDRQAERPRRPRAPRRGPGRRRPGLRPHGRREPVDDRDRGDPPRAPASTGSTSAGSRSRCPADDIEGHVRLARSTATPIAVGESMYSIAQFREYLDRGAAGIVQVDVARIGGITPWLKVAHLAEAFNVARVPALPDGTAREPRRRRPQRTLRRAHPAAARDHPHAR